MEPRTKHTLLAQSAAGAVLAYPAIGLLDIDPLTYLGLVTGSTAFTLLRCAPLFQQVRADKGKWRESVIKNAACLHASRVPVHALPTVHDEAPPLVAILCLDCDSQLCPECLARIPRDLDQPHVCSELARPKSSGMRSADSMPRCADCMCYVSQATSYDGRWLCRRCLEEVRYDLAQADALAADLEEADALADGYGIPRLTNSTKAALSTRPEDWLELSREAMLKAARARGWDVARVASGTKRTMAVWCADQARREMDHEDLVKARAFVDQQAICAPDPEECVNCDCPSDYPEVRHG